MFKDHTFIDLPKDMPPEIFEALKSVWVQGHQMNITLTKVCPRPGGKGGKFRKSFGKGGKKFSKGKDFKKKSKPRFEAKNCCIWATLPLSNERHYPACPNIPSWTWWNYDVPMVEKIFPLPWVLTQTQACGSSGLLPFPLSPYANTSSAFINFWDIV